MNIDILQGKWTELKDEIQRNWSQVTNEELENTKGNIRAMTGLLEEKYGKLKPEGHTKLSTIWNKFSPLRATRSRREVTATSPLSEFVVESTSFGANEEKPPHNDSPLVRTGPSKDSRSARPRAKDLPGSAPAKKDR